MREGVAKRVKFEFRRDIATDEHRYVLLIHQKDVVKVILDEFDRDLKDECTKSDKISDKLLFLEHFARKLEEVEEAEKANRPGQGERG